MSTLSLHDLGLRPAQMKAIEKKALHAGTTTPEYVRRLVERDLTAQSLDDILDPVREDFRKSGMTEEGLHDLVRRARQATSSPKSKNRRTAQS